jgi:hypothetical protein
MRAQAGGFAVLRIFQPQNLGGVERPASVPVEGVLRLFAIAGGEQEDKGNDAHTEQQSSDDLGQRYETGFHHGAGTIPGSR